MAASPLGIVGVTPRWVEAQKATPSFLQAAGNDGASPLDLPLPASLMTKHEQKGVTPTDPRGARSPRQSVLGSAIRSPPSARARTPPSGRSPGVPLHEDLLQRGRMYEMRREALQERAIHLELKKCRDVPKISAQGHAIKRNGDIVDRLYKVEAQKRKIYEFKMQAIELQEKKMFDEWFEPKISRRGSRSVGQTMKNRELWAFRRQERLEESRKQYIIKEMQHVQESPEINMRSEQLAAKRREREGLAGFSHIDAMIERDRLAKLARWEEQQRTIAEETPGTPRITALAANLAVEGDVVERLYQREMMRQQRLAEREQFAMEREQAMHSPSITATSHLLRQQTQLREETAARQQHVGGPQQEIDYGTESILERNARRVREKEARLESIREQERQRHTPKIDPVSAAIAAQLPMSPLERLSSIKNSSSKPYAASDDPPFDGNSHAVGNGSTTPRGGAQRLRAFGAAPSSSQQSPTPQQEATTPSSSRQQKPSAAAESPTPQQRQADSAAWLQRMQAAEARRRQRLEAAAKEAEERELADCTFSPVTAPSNRYRPTAVAGDGSQAAPPWMAQAAGGGSGDMDPFERQRQWLEKRNERLEQQRKEREARELAECTFQPQVQLGTEPAVPEESPLYGGDGRAWGYSQHVARLNEARDRHPSDDLRDPLPMPTRRTTTPHEFILGRSRTPPASAATADDRHTPAPRSPAVPSLARPVAPPVRADAAYAYAATQQSAGAGAEAARGTADALLQAASARAHPPQTAGRSPFPRGTPSGATPPQSQSQQPTSTYDNIEYLDDDDDDGII